jgi:hypothetical protein
VQELGSIGNCVGGLVYVLPDPTSGKNPIRFKRKYPKKKLLYNEVTKLKKFFNCNFCLIL